MCEASSIQTYAELRRDGHARRWIDAAVRHGRLTRVRRGVYAGTGSCEAARTAAVHGGALACVSAARHHGLWVLDDDPGRVHVWVRRDGHRHAHTACSCVEHWDGPGGETARGVDAEAFGLPSVPRVLRQILRCQGVEAFFVSLESALYLGVISRAGLAWLRACTGDAAREAIAFARSDAESGLESLLRWRLRHRSLRIRTQVTITGVGRVDFLIGDRLIIEVDGRANHDGDIHRHKDLTRDAAAAAWGYVTLRFDYAQIVHDWATVEDAILAQCESGHHRR